MDSDSEDDLLNVEDFFEVGKNSIAVPPSHEISLSEGIRINREIREKAEKRQHFLLANGCFDKISLDTEIPEVQADSSLDEIELPDLDVSAYIDPLIFRDINVLRKTNFQTIFTLSELTLSFCGYDSQEDLSQYERMLLDIEPSILNKSLDTVLPLCCSSVISNPRAMLKYLIFNVAVNPCVPSVVVSQKAILTLIKSGVNEIMLGDIYDVFLNFGADVNTFCPLRGLSIYSAEKCISSEPQQSESWEFNLRSTLEVLSDIIHYSSFSDKKLSKLIALLIWIGLDGTLRSTYIPIDIKKCLNNAIVKVQSQEYLESFVPAKLAKFGAYLEGVFPPTAHFPILYQILDHIPIYSPAGKILQKNTAFKILNLLCKFFEIPESTGKIEDIPLVIRLLNTKLRQSREVLKKQAAVEVNLFVFVCVINLCVGYEFVAELEDIYESIKHELKQSLRIINKFYSRTVSFQERIPQVNFRIHMMASDAKSKNQQTKTAFKFKPQESRKRKSSALLKKAQSASSGSAASHDTAIQQELGCSKARTENLPVSTWNSDEEDFEMSESISYAGEISLKLAGLNSPDKTTLRVTSEPQQELENSEVETESVPVDMENCATGTSLKSTKESHTLDLNLHDPTTLQVTINLQPALKNSVEMMNIPVSMDNMTWDNDGEDGEMSENISYAGEMPLKSAGLHSPNTTVLQVTSELQRELENLDVDMENCARGASLKSTKESHTLNLNLRDPSTLQVTAEVPKALENSEIETVDIPVSMDNMTWVNDGKDVEMSESISYAGEIFLKASGLNSANTTTLRVTSELQQELENSKVGTENVSVDIVSCTRGPSLKSTKETQTVELKLHDPTTLQVTAEVPKALENSEIETVVFPLSLDNMFWHNDDEDVEMPKRISYAGEISLKSAGLNSAITTALQVPFELQQEFANTEVEMLNIPVDIGSFARETSLRSKSSKATRTLDTTMLQVTAELQEVPQNSEVETVNIPVTMDNTSWVSDEDDVVSCAEVSSKKSKAAKKTSMPKLNFQKTVPLRASAPNQQELLNSEVLTGNVPAFMYNTILNSDDIEETVCYAGDKKKSAEETLTSKPNMPDANTLQASLALLDELQNLDIVENLPVSTRHINAGDFDFMETVRRASDTCWKAKSASTYQLNLPSPVMGFQVNAALQESQITEHVTENIPVSTNNPPQDKEEEEDDIQIIGTFVKPKNINVFPEVEYLRLRKFLNPVNKPKSKKQTKTPNMIELCEKSDDSDDCLIEFSTDPKFRPDIEILDGKKTKKRVA